METTLSVLLASHRPKSDTANSQNAATEAAARMRGRPILALMPVLPSLLNYPNIRYSDAGPRCSDSSDCAAGLSRSELTDRLLYAALLPDGVDYFDTGRVDLHPGIQLSHCGLVTDGSAPFPGRNEHGHTVILGRKHSRIPLSVAVM